MLLVLIARVRLHPAIALVIGAMALGVAAGMPLKQIPVSFSLGVGNLMGHIAIVLGLGAILGNLLARSGGAGALGSALVEGCGKRGLPWALLGLGILVGMPVFFEVGLVLLMPIVAAAARRSGRPPILVGMPLLAGLSIVHGALPPHPAAMLAATQYHADLGRTIFWGLLAGLPAAALAGPGLGWLLTRRWLKRTAGATGKLPEQETPIFGGPAETPATDCAPATPVPPIEIEPVPPPAGPIRAATAILLPIGLIFLGSWADSISLRERSANQIFRFIGSPDVALLIAVLAAFVTLGGRIQTGRHHGRELFDRCARSPSSPSPMCWLFSPQPEASAESCAIRARRRPPSAFALDAHMPPAFPGLAAGRQWFVSPWARPRSPWPSLRECSRRWSSIWAYGPSCLSLPPARVR